MTTVNSVIKTLAKDGFKLTVRARATKYQHKYTVTDRGKHSQAVTRTKVASKTLTLQGF